MRKSFKVVLRVVLVSGAAFAMVVGYLNYRQRKVEETIKKLDFLLTKSQRQKTKIRIGDDPTTVRQVVGIPTSRHKHSNGDEEWRWTEEARNVYLVPQEQWSITFAGNPLRIVEIMSFRTLPWTPEDSVVMHYPTPPSIYSVSGRLRKECGSQFNSDSTKIIHYFPLSYAETNEDTTYQRSQDSVRRVVVENLNEGKFVEAVGWAHIDRVSLPTCKGHLPMSLDDFR